MAMSDWVVIGAFQDELMALIAKGQLESAGMECRARLNATGDALLGSLGVQNGPTELLVERKNEQKARELLSGPLMTNRRVTDTANRPTHE